MGATQQGDGRFAALEKRYAGYRVHDRNGEEVGRLSDLFVDEHDRPEYIGVNGDFPRDGLVLIPIEAVAVNGDRGVIEVLEVRGRIATGPLFDSRAEMCPEYEARLRDHYGLGGSEDATEVSTERETRGEIKPVAVAPQTAQQTPAFPVAATLLILGVTALFAMLARRFANRG